MREAFPEQRGLGILPQLFGLFECSNLGIEVAQGRLCAGVNLLPVPVCQRSMLRGR